MLKEVVTSVTLVMASLNIARPPFKMAMSFVLVSNPVSLALEHLWLPTLVPGASEGLHILMNMLGPIRGLRKLLARVTKLALKLGRQAAGRRHGNILAEALMVDGTFNRGPIIDIVG
jgi:hypothetical protein